MKKLDNRITKERFKQICYLVLRETMYIDINDEVSVRRAIKQVIDDSEIHLGRLEFQRKVIMEDVENLNEVIRTFKPRPLKVEDDL